MDTNWTGLAHTRLQRNRKLLFLPGDRRPRAALDAAWLWARGRLKMHVAQRAILDCHAMAKDVTTAADAALCHAVGQACGTVHTAGHAMGYPVYELTAIVRALGAGRGARVCGSATAGIPRAPDAGARRLRAGRRPVGAFFAAMRPRRLSASPARTPECG